MTNKEIKTYLNLRIEFLKECLEDSNRKISDDSWSDDLKKLWIDEDISIKAKLQEAELLLQWIQET